MSSATIPRGPIDTVKIFAISITPAAVSANTTAEQAFTVVGLSVSDYVAVQSLSAQTTGIIVANCRVSAVNTLAIQFANITAGGLTPVSGSYEINLASPESLPLDSNAL